VVGIADQGDDSVAALRQDPGETQGDLAVAAGNGYTLASAYVRGWPASLQVVWFVLALIQSERRILVPHQGDIDQDPVEPAIDAHKQVEEAARIPPGDQQEEAGEDDDQVEH
jgi:hypothetical protein